jgi:UDP-N-acetylglucosamine acyltransferase
VFHQFIRVGRLVITQGLSAFAKDIPPFTLAALRSTVIGLNVVGLRRAGLGAAERQEIKEAFRLLYRGGLNITQALERSRERSWGPHGRAFFDFAATAKKRGLCALLRRGRGAPDQE